MGGYRVLIIGANGQLGRDIVRQLNKTAITTITSDINGEVDHNLDITDEKVVDEIVVLNPHAIINCAAWTAVDAAEDEENKDKVYALNVTGVKNIVKAAQILDCKLLQISTDYVFDGSGYTPWQADDKNFGPLNYYGETKLLGEKEVEKLNKFFIVRISWLFGKYGNNFVKTMLDVGKTHDEVRVIDDQVGTPTYTVDLAKLLVEMIVTEKYGYYHASNEGGYISWYDFCVEIYKQAKIDCKVIPVSSEEYGLSKAVRPMNSQLDKSKLDEMGFERLPDWKDALRRYLKELDYE